jgi:uncharacterized protein (DUF3820 family)
MAQAYQRRGREPMKMPFGKHKGKEMDDVPAAYLMWLYESDVKGVVHAYIENNIKGIKKQIEDGNGEM